MTDEGQLVTLGAAGPVSVTTLDAGRTSHQRRGPACQAGVTREVAFDDL